MKEKFMKRRLVGTINVKCKYDDGTVRVWEEQKIVVVQHIIDIVEEYRQLGYKLTLRQLHYQMVTNNWIVNHDTAYKKLGNVLDDCRYAGLIDWEAIEDRGRIPQLDYAVDSIEQALQDTWSQYKRDRMQGQEITIELWTEKDALSEILRRVTDRFHVRLCVNKGYTSSSAAYQAYKRILGSIEENRPVFILYFGDHDPSGLDMVRDIRDRLTFMLENGVEGETVMYQGVDRWLEVKAIGLTMQQIRQYRLPPNPTKLTDTRADKYIQKYGKTCWEVDALRPQVLTKLVEDNIIDLIDVDQYNKMLKIEATNKKIVKEIVDKARDFDSENYEDDILEKDE